jgi:uncharacterized protein YunC (DUF1805 family)
MKSLYMHKIIKVGKARIEAIQVRLLSKNFVLLRGRLGYVMCGYLNLKTAEKFKDRAVKVTGVSGIKDTLNAKVHSCTSQARKLGIAKGQTVREALKKFA